MISKRHPLSPLFALAVGASACGDVVSGATSSGATTSETTATTSSTTTSTTSGPCSMDCPPLPGPEALGTAVLGNATDTSVTLSLMTAEALEIYVEYGGPPGNFPASTKIAATEANVPVVFVLGDLAPSSPQSYRVRYRAVGGADFAASEERSFHTQRAPGETFTFTMQADSHRDENSNLDLYRTALANIRADHADFHVDLGDTFMTEKFAKTEDEIVARYIEERGYFGRISDVVPLLLANGNHEGEIGWLNDGTADNMAVWTTNARLKYYVNPLPDGFFSGDATSYPFVGERGGYYAFTWGDALFVVLDPFWFTKKKPAKANQDGWTWTLGDEQYHWLESTLEGSAAKYKFVFSHHMTGGADDARGGVEFADRWEWGGKNAAGVDEFAQKRPGWARPIHQLFIDTKVSAWFHGHDHLYCKQDKDGIVYQEVPQPSHQGENGAMTAAEWGYVEGKILSSSGHLRVTVAPQKTTVEYVQAFLPEDETPAHKNGQIADSYDIPAP